MNHRVSHSALNVFSECSEKYRLKYIEKYRSLVQPSALWFGSAIDEAIEVLLLKKKKNLSERELDLLLTKSAHDIFTSKMQEIYNTSNQYFKFFKSDFDPEVFTVQDLRDLNTRFPEIQDWHQFHESNAKKCSKDALETFNYLVWLSLYRKGEMLLTAYENDILPHIEEVFDIQKEINLTNSSGDVLTGKIDFTATFVGDSNIYICDNKTSSRPYEKDSVSTSEQLSIYTEAENIKHAAYIVLEKKIRKNEPKVRTQMIFGEIPEETYEKVFTNIENKLNLINAGNFEKKELAKNCFAFGSPCEYYGLCWGGDTSLIYKKENK